MIAFHKFDARAFLESEEDDATVSTSNAGLEGTEPLDKQKQAFPTFAAFAAFAKRGQRNPETERRAYEAAVINWMNRSAPINLDPNKCAACRRSLGQIGQDSVPFLSGNGAHVWLHHGCHGDWMAQRRVEAVEALTAMGLPPPAGWKV